MIPNDGEFFLILNIAKCSSLTMTKFKNIFRIETAIKYAVETRHASSLHFSVETRPGESLQNDSFAQFGQPIRNSLSVIINQFKGSVKRWANKNNYPNFSWQPRFYDRIIRNEKELYNIRKYTEQNLLKWEFERSKPENIFDF
jgi:hypothetical protein